MMKITNKYVPVNNTRYQVLYKIDTPDARQWQWHPGQCKSTGTGCDCRHKMQYSCHSLRIMATALRPRTRQTPLSAGEKKKKKTLCNPFSTACSAQTVPFWGQTTWNLAGLSTKRDCGSKGINSSHVGVESNQGRRVRQKRKSC